MAPHLEKVFDVRAELDKGNVNLGPVSGNLVRSIANVPGGWIRGSGVEGKILPGSGDWLLVSYNDGEA
jgi:hypothetical protein